MWEWDPDRDLLSFAKALQREECLVWRTCYSIQVLNNKQVFPELYWLMAGHVVGTDGGFGLIFGRLWAISWFNLTQSYSPVSLSCQYNKMWVITVQKAAPNVAFCASDISCIRKMALSFKIYDTPYRTEVSSLTHPSIQPPESASNAHHVLMNMINLCAGSLWTLFKHAPSAPTKHLTAVSDHQMFWRP